MRTPQVSQASLALERRKPANLAVVICNHNDPRLAETVHSVKDTAPPGQTEIVVADNASHDRSVQEVEAAFRTVHILRFPENLGWSGAANRAADAIQSKNLLFLKPGFELQPRSLQRCLSFMNRFPQVGVACCRVVDPEGRLIDVCREIPNIRSSLLYALWWLPSRLRPVRHFLGRWMTRYHDGAYDRYVGYNDVPFVLVKREVFARAGGFEESLTQGGEWRDFYKRVQDLGYRGAFIAEAEVVLHCAPFDHRWDLRRKVGRHRERLHFLNRHADARTRRYFETAARIRANLGILLNAFVPGENGRLRRRMWRKIRRLSPAPDPVSAGDPG